MSSKDGSLRGGVGPKDAKGRRRKTADVNLLHQVLNYPLERVEPSPNSHASASHGSPSEQSMQTICPFDFYPTRSCRGSHVLRDHIHRHLMHSRELCLSGGPLTTLTHYLCVEGRWLCSKCCHIYIRRRSCVCGFSFGGDNEFPFLVADGHPLLSPSSEPEPEMTSRGSSSSFLDDATVFSILRRS